MQVDLYGFKISFVSTSLLKTTQGDPVFRKKEEEREEEKEEEEEEEDNKGSNKKALLSTLQVLIRGGSISLYKLFQE